MGQDLFRWDEGGVLKHHCPICQTPLSHEKCRTTCLGRHVEWCHRYHSLFRVNWASRCAACKTTDEQHEKRHRDIAEILHRVKKLVADKEAAAMALSTPRAPRTLLTADALHNIADPLTPSPSSSNAKTTKREKKAAKKVAKAMERDKVVTTADIERVAQVLHPEPEKEAAKADDESEDVPEDEDIKWNLSFNYTTCNTKSLRHDYIARDRNDQFEVPEDDIRSILEKFEVNVNVGGKEGDLVAELTKAIKSDLQCFHEELETTARSKAGFWRWANKKHYRALMDRGKEWDDKHKPFDRKDSEAELEARRGSTQDRDQNAATGEDDDCGASSHGSSVIVPSLTNSAGTIEETVLTAPSTLQDPQAERMLVGLSPETPKKCSTSKQTPAKMSVKADSAQDQGWTQVGKKPTKPLPKPAKVKISLSGNGGLRHLAPTKPKGKFGALSWADTAKGQ
ncbi:hypothetical protein CERZMDRAFT_81233 [Cercospora zeae-maydis SCOH1-5]|uniref:Uncharacterized protein n=1 Tax=Cercospora zeae-maydis SCOH1-5 TaxID=717836 RepID=A0A6A6FUX1_9PEZI|nr:hypothetical protein CERZMDRAFT_81233 [Cercospora zeae-maydis SCOH1-5]